jgi:hypothetical protein
MANSVLRRSILLAMQAVVRMFIAVLVTLRVPVRAAAWTLILWLIGVSKAERRRVGIAAAKRDLDLPDPPPT